MTATSTRAPASDPLVGSIAQQNGMGMKFVCVCLCFPRHALGQDCPYKIERGRGGARDTRCELGEIGSGRHSPIAVGLNAEVVGTTHDARPAALAPVGA